MPKLISSKQVSGLATRPRPVLPWLALLCAVLAFKLMPMPVLANDAGSAQVLATDHPLIFKYVLPAALCDGEQAQVQFISAKNALPTFTPAQACDGKDKTFLLAGMTQATDYTAVAVVEVQRKGSRTRSGKAEPPRYAAPLSFTTGTIPAALKLPVLNVLKAADAHTSKREGLVWLGFYRGPSVAFNLAGEVVWYGKEPAAQKIGFLSGGRSVAIEADEAGNRNQLLRIRNLLGEVLREIHIREIDAQVPEQLSNFHHDVLELDDGKLVLLLNEESMQPRVQDKGEIAVMSDYIAVLDTQGKVSWTWRGLAHWDLQRDEAYDVMCRSKATGCPTILAESAYDWTHANSLDLDGAGNLLLSLRHYDAALQIRYQNGRGDGRVEWVLGKGGDFTMKTSAAPMWMSGQHDLRWIGERDLLLLDNGNMRCKAGSFGTPVAACASHIVHLRIDPRRKRAEELARIDLGHFAAVAGSAQRLSNGNYWGALSDIFLARSMSLSEFRPDGSLSLRLTTAEGGAGYRALRLPDMYRSSQAR